jgi:hypothetical protein
MVGAIMSGQMNYEDTESCYKALKDLYVTGQLNPDDYYKGVVAVAYQFAQRGEVSRAMELLLVPPEDYYRNSQLDQMRIDADYREVVVQFAHWIATNCDEFIKPNMPSALA